LAARVHHQLGAQLLIYQPQVASWDAQKKMLAYAAVAYQAKGAAMPVLGTATIEADTSVSFETRLVKFTRLRVTESNFPTLDRDKVRDIVDTLQDGIPETDRVIALDRVLESVDRSQIRTTNVAGVKSDPPVIFYSTMRSILVNLDGDPVWSPIPQNDLKYAVNTNWDLFQHEPTKTYYLRSDRVWMKATVAQRAVDSIREIAGELLEASRGRQLERGEVRVVRRRIERGDSAGVCQHGSSRAHLRPGATHLYERAGRQPTRVAAEHRGGRISHGTQRPDVLPGCRTMVLGARPHRTMDLRNPHAS
jgi:hypothetical protein